MVKYSYELTDALIFVQPFQVGLSQLRQELNNSSIYQVDGIQCTGLGLSATHLNLDFSSSLTTGQENSVKALCLAHADQDDPDVIFMDVTEPPNPASIKSAFLKINMTQDSTLFSGSYYIGRHQTHEVEEAVQTNGLLEISKGYGDDLLIKNNCLTARTYIVSFTVNGYSKRKGKALKCWIEKTTDPNTLGGSQHAVCGNDASSRNEYIYISSSTCLKMQPNEYIRLGFYTGGEYQIINGTNITMQLI